MQRQQELIEVSAGRLESCGHTGFHEAALELLGEILAMLCGHMPLIWYLPRLKAKTSILQKTTRQQVWSLRTE